MILQVVSDSGDLARISHRVSCKRSDRGGAEGRGYKARDRRPRRRSQREALGLDQYVEESEGVRA